MQPGQQTHHQLTCPICHNLFTSPRTLDTCKHSFCRICLDLLLATHAPPCPCPVCQYPVSPERITNNLKLLHAVRYHHDSAQLAMPRKRSVSPSDLDSLSSGSDTELDLPEPSSFLELSSGQSNALESPLRVHTEEVDTQLNALEAEVGGPGEPSHERQVKNIRSDAEVHSEEKEGCAEDIEELPATPAPKRRSARIPRSPSKRQRRASAKTHKGDSSLTLVEGPSQRRRSLNDEPSATAQPAVDLAILTTGVGDAQLRKLKQTARRAATHLSWNIRIHNQPSLLGDAVTMTQQADKNVDTYTHVLTVPNKNNRVTRTFKYLVGLVLGAWVVDVKWLTDSIEARKLLPEADYMVQGDTATENCRLDGPYTPGALLNGYRFYVWGELDLGPAYPNADALKLIRAAGGDIVAHCPAAQPGEHGEPGPLVVAESCKPAIKAIRRPDHRRLFAIPVSRALPTILIDNKHLASARKAAEVLDSLIEATGGGLACRPKSWLLDCISANELV